MKKDNYESQIYIERYNYIYIRYDKIYEVKPSYLYHCYTFTNLFLATFRPSWGGWSLPFYFIKLIHIVGQFFTWRKNLDLAHN